MEPQRLKQFIRDLYLKRGFKKEHADICAWHTTLAEEWSVKTHGINLLEWYMDTIEKKCININPDIKIEKINNNFHLLDADRAHGQIGTELAARKTIEVLDSDECSVCIVGIKNSNHFGMAGAPTYTISKAGYIGILISSTPPIIAPVGGAEKAVGSNPISVGFPIGDGEPIIFDASLSVNALNKIIVSQNENKPIPDHSYLNVDGVFTTDIDEIKAHKLAAPLGGYLETSGHKGFGLAFVSELLTTCLIGGLTSEQLFTWNRDVKGPAAEAHIVIGLKQDIYREKGLIEKEVRALLAFIKSRKKVKGVDEILVPGEDRYQSKKNAGIHNLDLRDWQIDILKRLAEKYNILPIGNDPVKE